LLRSNSRRWVNELGHLFLGHLGADRKLNIPDGASRPPAGGVGAESVAYFVCARNDVFSKSERYLSNVEENTTLDRIDIYQIMLLFCLY
jgi:hypothetical protein